MLLLRSFCLTLLPASSRLRRFRFSFLALHLALRLLAGAAVASVFSFAGWRWIFLRAAVSRMRLFTRVRHKATTLLN